MPPVFSGLTHVLTGLSNQCLALEALLEGWQGPALPYDAESFALARLEVAAGPPVHHLARDALEL
jgi:hypothetical protein